MYLSSIRTAVPARHGGGRVPATVFGLGLVSLVTDISAEMVTAVLPLYLMYGVGVGFMSLGAIEGLYVGASAVLRVAGGYLADRLGRPKTVAAVGYGLSAVAKLGFPLAGGSVPATATVVMADRAGKGIRTGPRDAMITLATPDEVLGRAFGVHRAMDTTGALLGPLLATALVTLAAGYDTVFVTSFALGLIGLLILMFFVPAPLFCRTPRVMLKSGGPPSGRPRCGVLRDLRGVLRAGLSKVCLVVGLLGVVTVGDMVLYVVVQQQASLPSAVLPLLPLGTAVTFLVAATPVGLLADRVGRWRVFLVGHVLLLVTYLLVGFAPGLAVLALGLHGLFYAATDGVLMAYVGPLIPEATRSTGISAVQTIQAVARASGAVVVGVVLQFASPQIAFAGLAVLLGTAILIGVKLS